MLAFVAQHQKRYAGIGLFSLARRVDMFGRWKRSPLERAIVDAAVEPRTETRVALLKLLAGSALYVAVREPVAMDVDSQGVLRAGASLTLLTGTGPNAPVLLAFTTEQQLRRRKSDAHALLLPIVTLYNLIVQQNHNGVVINPADKWVFVSREELRTAIPAAG